MHSRAAFLKRLGLALIVAPTAARRVLASSQGQLLPLTDNQPYHSKPCGYVGKRTVGPLITREYVDCLYDRDPYGDPTLGYLSLFDSFDHVLQRRGPLTDHFRWWCRPDGVTDWTKVTGGRAIGVEGFETRFGHLPRQAIDTFGQLIPHGADVKGPTVTVQYCEVSYS